jgi:starch synthase
MRILMVAPEMAPFAKVGGLGDVIGALPKTLAQKGHELAIVLPLYGCVHKEGHWQALQEPLKVNLGIGPLFAKVWKTDLSPNISVYFIEHNQYFGRYEIYAGPWGEHKDNGERFTFLSRAALDLCHHISWYPDIIHCHDWTSGLIPVYLNTVDASSPLGHAATVFTIHNLEHQGIFPAELLAFTGLPQSVFVADGLESYRHLNMLKGGLYHATKLSTVSPHYAQEIQGPELGCGLDAVLRFRAGDLVGILNGIDTEHWNPAIDPLLPENYSFKDLKGKAACKRLLQERFKLNQDPNIPIFSTVSRLFYQKGLDVLIDIMDELMSQQDLQLIVLGNGDGALERAFSHFARQYPGAMNTYIGYDSALAHLIKGGADFFLMPSRFEPCGLTQLYAMIYGSLPIARATGGLVDTVQNHIPHTLQGTGFMFQDLSAHTLLHTINWAKTLYQKEPEVFKALQLNAMKQDFSWDLSAQKYEELYTWAIRKRLHFT